MAFVISGYFAKGCQGPFYTRFSIGIKIYIGWIIPQVISKVDSIFYIMTVGENIKKLRKAHGLTQAQLGQKIGTRQKVIADYENENSKPPRDRLLALSKFFAVKVEELIGKDDVRLPEEKPKGIHGNARIVKMQEMFEKLSPDDQRSVMKHVSGLLARTGQNNNHHEE